MSFIVPVKPTFDYCISIFGFPSVLTCPTSNIFFSIPHPIFRRNFFYFRVIRKKIQFSKPMLANPLTSTNFPLYCSALSISLSSVTLCTLGSTTPLLHEITKPKTLAITIIFLEFVSIIHHQKMKKVTKQTSITTFP